MVTQILYINRVEPILGRAGKDFTEAWYHPAGKNVLLNPWITCMLFQGADKMQKEQPAWL